MYYAINDAWGENGVDSHVSQRFTNQSLHEILEYDTTINNQQQQQQLAKIMSNT